MATEFKLPELGENIDAADVISVLVKPGDKVEKEQGLIEIETDKATIEVPSNKSGVIKDVLIKEGDNVKVGQAIITFEEEGGKKEKEEPSKEEKNEEENKGEEKKEKKEEETKNKAESKPQKQTKQTSGSKQIVEMKLPELGENIDSADVLSVLVKEGEQIEKDQGVLEIETDKATIEVPSSYSGKIAEVLIHDGDKAKVGQTILKIETGEGAEEESAAEEKTEPEEEEKTKPEAEEETKPEAEEAGTPTGTRSKTSPGEVDNQPPISKGAAPAAPSVRRIAREIGVDINKVPGSGPGGRISMDDVKAFSKKLHEEGAAATGGPGFSVKQEALPDFSKFGEIERKSMSNIRSKTAEHMGYSWASIPHVTQFDKADITELERIRKQFNPQVEKSGGKLTVTSILLKVITSALKVFPQFNTSIDIEKREIIYKKYFNVGVAVDTDHGLIVPVIKNVNKKNLVELSAELNKMAEKARMRKISLEELQGGSITITNLGGIGGTYFTPIVNSPEVAILGVSRGGYEPKYNGDKFEPRLMLPLSLSYDHRIIDGADAARFLRWVCEALEQPMKLLIEG